MIMTTKEQLMDDAWRTARNARRSAQYALNRLVAVGDCCDPAECARLTEDAESALEDGATDATLALAEFHRACNM
jgi:hypothetical protein